MMKLMLLVIVAIMATSNLGAQIISRKGYPEHFIAGAGIAAGVSYFTFKKTDDKLKAWIFGFGASVAAGGIKELLDPVIFNGTRNVKDFQYTALGGLVGASIVIPLRKRKAAGTMTFGGDGRMSDIRNWGKFEDFRGFGVSSAERYWILGTDIRILGY